jgi:hypothetical protein
MVTAPRSSCPRMNPASVVAVTVWVEQQGCGRLADSRACFWMGEGLFDLSWIAFQPPSQGLGAVRCWSSSQHSDGTLQRTGAVCIDMQPGARVIWRRPEAQRHDGPSPAQPCICFRSLVTCWNTFPQYGPARCDLVPMPAHHAGGMWSSAQGRAQSHLKRSFGVDGVRVGKLHKCCLS